ncbi:hypothetical protein MOE47_07065 [Bacillus atrophaeus]|uniref:hypothetical protein n=1 Tax=Bacillus atrophaeus TaxID=1452 RepID=UPI002282306B|nr:hypothetical protein [Bacillus atrophaeus]MCY8912316.1 hypothetical protein [Bacillus atrophaeus]MCY9114186.1 hypothetical protein [Bacillus atrophaeus]MEC0926867.1 hypothetical protein [Bacillus atrophaeus]MEC0932293.1 hypothetical protein [Bacillus atrophaeus]
MGNCFRFAAEPRDFIPEVSLYVEEKKLLIAADALVKTDGALHRPVEEATLDMDQPLLSLGDFRL